ncbi:ABC transporter permease [Isoptericola sp. NEAU-Y5]|uniref:ABC transporter permease n=1 Tax=Isoptericola luteus TaxID=2879484 RepID=A0ABS7ZHF5_9MICO|nr:ABC transporter permease [Isoptericola sp. NEAU-Y5]MCA5894465.1 ABC transporter permease [Isoptericola sp. NEAU-Y5]
MTAATLAAPAQTTTVKPLTFATLTHVEWRKQLDTRAGRWLLIVIAIVTAAVLAIMMAVNGGDHSFSAFVVGTTTPMALLLPIVGVLAATSEWSQRTALVTFTLEPRRTRVGFAKVVSAIGSGLALLVLSIGLAALAHLLVVTFRDATPAWDVSVQDVAYLALSVVLFMIQGVGFGLLLRSTPVAIVTLLLLPTLFGIVGGLVPAMATVLPWIDLGTAGEPLLFGGTIDAEGWAQLTTATLLWVVAPLTGGLWRVARSEITSA